MLVAVSNLLLQESYGREWKQIAFIARFYGTDTSLVKTPLFAVPHTCAFYQNFPSHPLPFSFVLIADGGGNALFWGDFKRGH